MNAANAQTALANLYAASRKAALSADDHELMERSRDVLAAYISAPAPAEDESPAAGQEAKQP